MSDREEGKDQCENNNREAVVIVPVQREIFSMRTQIKSTIFHAANSISPLALSLTRKVREDIYFPRHDAMGGDTNSFQATTATSSDRAQPSYPPKAKHSPNPFPLQVPSSPSRTRRIEETNSSSQPQTPPCDPETSPKSHHKQYNTPREN